MKQRICYTIICSLILSLSNMRAQEVIQLYDGSAPGSETWDWEEGMFQDKITGVTRPTLTVYRPENPNGIGIVVCPGGAFCFLSFDQEGVNLSKCLNEKGITCFILKYRLCHADNIMDLLKEVFVENNLDAVGADVIPLAIQDGGKAISYVRSHAAEYGLDPNKIGITGSSAGGTVTMGTAMKFTDDECRPNFAVATYPYFSPHIGGNEAPSEHPLPLFITAASNDQMVPIKHSLDFYNLWLEKKQSVEMHIYQKGDHGFVGTKLGLAVDDWTENLFRWFGDIYPENMK